MPGIKNLNKGDRPDIEKRADEFISSASSTTPRRKRYQRYNLSLNHQVSADIDKISCLPREFRASRSDVVKAGIEALKKLSEDQIVALLADVIRSSKTTPEHNQELARRAADDALR